MSSNTKKINNLKNIIGAAEKLFFVHDYNRVSMCDIAKLVNVTKPALYYHFKNKPDLYLTVIRFGFEKFKNELKKTINSEEFKQDDLEKKIEKIFSIYAKFIKNGNGIIKILLKKIDTNEKKIIKFIEEMRNELIDILQPLSEEILHRKKIEKLLTHKEATFLLLGMLSSFGKCFFRDNLNNNPQIVAKKITSFIFS